MSYKDTMDLLAILTSDLRNKWTIETKSLQTSKVVRVYSFALPTLYRMSISLKVLFLAFFSFPDLTSIMASISSPFESQKIDYIRVIQLEMSTVHHLLQ